LFNFFIKNKSGLEDNIKIYKQGNYKNYIEKYAKVICEKYRSKIKKLSKDQMAKLGWVPDMSHDGLNKEYQDLNTIKKYIDVWYKSKSINKSFFELDKSLLDKSHKFHQIILRSFLDESEMKDYSLPGSSDFVNALDYQLITSITKDTKKEKIERVLDFGGGYARQTNLFTKHHNCKEFTIVDAIEDSYVVQSTYLKIAKDWILEDFFFNEYLLDDLNFKSNKKNINHLMTFEMDLIPDQHYDLIICSNVLNEITSYAFTYVIKQISRILKIGGILYIKDHGLFDQSGHRYHDDIVLQSLNFVLEYRPFVTDLKDIHTIPRIYRKYGDKKPSYLNPAQNIESWQS
jgi:SAM-dependent methyltransferase